MKACSTWWLCQRIVYKPRLFTAQRGGYPWWAVRSVKAFAQWRLWRSASRSCFATWGFGTSGTSSGGRHCSSGSASQASACARARTARRWCGRNKALLVLFYYLFQAPGDAWSKSFEKVRFKRFKINGCMWRYGWKDNAFGKRSRAKNLSNTWNHSGRQTITWGTTCRSPPHRSSKSIQYVGLEKRGARASFWKNKPAGADTYLVIYRDIGDDYTFKLAQYYKILKKNKK